MSWSPAVEAMTYTEKAVELRRCSNGAKERNLCDCKRCAAGEKGRYALVQVSPVSTKTTEILKARLVTIIPGSAAVA